MWKKVRIEGEGDGEECQGGSQKKEQEKIMTCRGDSSKKSSIKGFSVLTFRRKGRSDVLICPFMRSSNAVNNPLTAFNSLKLI